MDGINITIDQIAHTINVKGATYKFSVFRGGQEITGEGDWTKIAEQATKIALKLVQKTSIKKANIVLEGLPERGGHESPEIGNVSLKSAKITPKRKERAFESRDIPSHPSKIKKNLKKIEICYSQLLNPKPLNNPQPLNNPSPPQPSKIATIKVADDGRCLDISLAQVLNLSGDNQEEKAKTLRITASSYLRGENNDRDTDPTFLGHLKASIKAIPKLEGFQEYRKLAKKEDPIPEEIKTLREFYADYITKEGNDGKMNYLDQAFLYVLPKINSAWKIALVSKEGKSVLLFQKNAPLNLDDWTFVYFEKKHYELVDRENKEANEKLIEMIEVKNSEILSQFLDLLQIRDELEGGKPENIKKELFESLKVKHPKAFNALAYCMYMQDLKNNLNPTGDKYGEEKLESLSPIELKKTLITFPRQEIHQKIEEFSNIFDLGKFTSGSAHFQKKMEKVHCLCLKIATHAPPPL